MKRFSIRTMTVLAAGAATLGALGLAAANAHPGDRVFEKLDEDGDGRVSVEELADKAEDRARKADANGDGYITREEMEARREEKRAKWRARRFPDANNDGVVTRAEFEDAAAKRFDKLDKNNDGVISEDEAPKKRKRGRSH